MADCPLVWTLKSLYCESSVQTKDITRLPFVTKSLYIFIGRNFSGSKVLLFVVDMVLLGSSNSDLQLSAGTSAATAHP